MTDPLDLAEAETALHRLMPTANLSVGGRWIPAADLLADRQAVADLVADHARVRSITVERHAASLFFQRYSHRLCSAVVGTWILTGLPLDAAAEQATVQVRDGSPVGMHLTGALRPTPSVEEFAAGLLEGHLLPLAAHLRETSRLSQAQAFGNIAAAIGMAARTVSRLRPADQVLEAVAPLLESRAALARLGSFRILEGHNGPRLFYDRATCCRWFEIPDGAYCSYCSRLSADERTRRFTDAMDTEVPPP